MYELNKLPQLNGLKILVVEDEYLLADEICAALKFAGAEIIGPVSSRAEGIDLARMTEHLDGAVLDINLRDEPVFDIATVLRERGIPFVFATGYDEGAVLPEFRDVPRFSKPFDAKAIFAQLKSDFRLHAV